MENNDNYLVNFNQLQNSTNGNNNENNSPIINVNPHISTENPPYNSCSFQTMTAIEQEDRKEKKVIYCIIGLILCMIIILLVIIIIMFQFIL